MKALIRKFERKGGGIMKNSILFFLSMMLFSINIVAQDVNNIKNSLEAIRKEQEKIAFQEKMTYVYMVLGFMLVIGVAWFSTTYFAKKNKKAADEARLQRAAVAKHPPQTHAKTSAKKYGSNKNRR